MPLGAALDRDRARPSAARLAGLPRIRRAGFPHEPRCPRQPRTAVISACFRRDRHRSGVPLYTDEDGDGRFVWRAPTLTASVVGSGARRRLSNTTAMGDHHAADRHLHPSSSPALSGASRTHALLHQDVTIVPARSSDTENAQTIASIFGNDDGPEIGAGWKRTGERAAGDTSRC